MVRTTFSGREIISVLRSFVHTGEVRNVAIPMHDGVKVETLRSVAD